MTRPSPTIAKALGSVVPKYTCAIPHFIQISQAFNRGRAAKSTQVGTVVAYRGTSNIRRGALHKNSFKARERGFK